MNQSYAREFLGEMSPAGQQVAQALSPYQQFRVSGRVGGPPQPQSQFPDPLLAFDELDPADDQFMEKQDLIFRSSPDLVQDPGVQGRIKQAARMHAEAQSYFKDDPELAAFYAEQRAQNVPPAQAFDSLRTRAMDNALKGSFLKAGGLVEEYEGLRDPQTGRVDKFSALDYLNRRSREGRVKPEEGPKELTAEAYNRLLTAEDDLAAVEQEIPGNPEDDAKLKAKAFRKKFGRDPDSKEDWTSAYNLAYPNVEKARSRVANLKQAYSKQYRLPPELGGESPVQQGTLVNFATGESFNPAVDGVAPPANTTVVQQGTQQGGPTKQDASSWLSKLKQKLQ